jgi:heme exporter protein C
MLSLLFPYVNFAASLFYLYWRQRDPLKALTADAVAISSAEVTVVYATICLWTGMLWGRVAWGHLVDLGRAPHQHVAAVAALRQLPDAAQALVTGQTTRSRRSSRSSPPSMCPSSICRSSGGAPSILRRSSAAARTPDRPVDEACVPGTSWVGDVGHLPLVFRYALERRRQASEQDAALQAIEASLEIASETRLDVRQQHGSASPALCLPLGVADSGRILRMGRVALDAHQARTAPAADSLASGLREDS